MMDKTGKKKGEQLAEAKNESKTKQKAQNTLSIFITAKKTTALKTLSNDLKLAKSKRDLAMTG